MSNIGIVFKSFLSAFLCLLALTYGSRAAFAYDQGAIEYLSHSIPNFHQVTESIYRGANPFTRTRNGAGGTQLMNLGVAMVIDLQGGDIDGTLEGFYSALTEPGERIQNIRAEKEYFESRGVLFVNLPLNSHAPVTLREELDIQEALKLLAQATPRYPAFIHCEHGTDRTGLVIALYRIFY